MGADQNDDHLEIVLREELSQLHAELAMLPSDAFAERSPLLARRDQISDQLRHLVTADSSQLAEWAEQAARKPRELDVRPPIPSYGSGGRS